MKKTLFTIFILLYSTLLHAELFTMHFEDGTVKSQIEYIKGTRTATKAGIKHGYEKVYYNNGQLAYEVHNTQGERDSALHWYDRKGNHLEVMHFQKGKRHGLNKTFFADGTLRIEVSYINDIKEGPEKFYFSTGALASEVKYVNGKKEGQQKEYNLDGTLNNDVMYKNGFKEGKKHWYDKHGKVIRTERYKRNRPIDLLKKIRAKKPEQTIDAFQVLDFNPNNRKVK